MLGALLVLLVLLDPLVRFESDHMASDATGGCAQLHGVSVDYGPWPTADRALTGHLSGLTVRADEVLLGSLVVSAVHGTIGDVSYSPWSLVSGSGSVTVHDGRISASLAPATIQTYLNSKGVPGQIAWAPEAAGLQIELLGFSIPLFVQAADGGVSLSLLAPSLARVLPLQLVVKVPGVNVESVKLSPQGLTVAAVINGQTARLACAARALVA